MPPDDIDLEECFADGVGIRFFHINVFSRSGCHNHGGTVPLFADRQDNPVDVWAVKHFVETAIGSATSEFAPLPTLSVGCFDGVSCIVASPSVRIGNGKNLRIFISKRVAKVPAVHSTDPTKAKRDTIAWRNGTIQSESRTGNQNGRRNRPQDRCLQKMPACDG
jgi:hypothetical protein